MAKSPKSKKPAKPAHQQQDAGLRPLMQDMGIRHPICFPFSPRKAVAALQLLIDTVATPPARKSRKRVHLAFKGVMAVLWLADVEHFRTYGRPITGTRWQAYPKGPVARDLVSLLQRDPAWVSELTDSGFALPFELEGASIVGRTPFDHPFDPAKLLSRSDSNALTAALKAAKALKNGDRDAAIRGEAFQFTPLYQDIPWEFLLPAKMRDKDTLADLAWTSRHILM